jgi:hypothetical protein
MDVMRAEPARGPDGRMAVSVIFTGGGAKKIRDLSAAQMNKLIAMVLDGKVIFRPEGPPWCDGGACFRSYLDVIAFRIAARCRS